VSVKIELSLDLEFVSVGQTRLYFPEETSLLGFHRVDMKIFSIGGGEKLHSGLPFSYSGKMLQLLMSVLLFSDYQGLMTFSVQNLMYKYLEKRNPIIIKKIL